MHNNPLIDFTNLEQKSAANPNDWVWANANAGSGKTKVLIDRIARILLHGADPAKILAVTYTKAAAAEMTTRLFETLGRWTITPDDELQKILNSLDENLIKSDAQLSKARALFASALETPGGLKVQTIHAFCGDILRRFPIEAGVAPGFEVADDLLANDMKERALRDAKNQMPEIFEELNEKVGRFYAKPSIFRTGESLDETDLDINALKANILKTFGLSQNLSIDEEIENALNSFSKSDLKSMLPILENHEDAKANDFAFAFKILLDGGNITAFDEILALLITSKKEIAKRVPIGADIRKNPKIREFFGEAKKDDGWNLGAFAEFWEYAQKVEIARLIERTIIIHKAAYQWRRAFNEIKSRLGRLDFADLLKHTSRLLNRDAGSALWVMYKLDQGLEHILIDESQDTSEEQWQILRPLLLSLENETHKLRRTGFVVGDDKQSIYSFQGADPKAYKSEKNQFLKSNNAKEVKFSVSFRTGDTILEMVDRVWHQACEYEIETEIPQNAPKSIVSIFETARENQRSHFSARKNQGSVLEFWELIQGKSKKENRDAWDYPLDAQSDNDSKSKLAQTIAREVKARIINGELIWEKGCLRECKAKDFMILVKARNSLFHRIIKNLKKEGIDVAGSDLIILKDEPAVLDILAVLQFIARPEDDFNLACLLKSAFFNLVQDDNDLFELCYQREQNLFMQLRDSKKQSHKNIYEILTRLLEDLAPLTPFEIISNILNANFDGQNTGWQMIFKRFGIEAKEPIEILLDLAIDAQKNQAASLNAFIDFIENRAPAAKREFDASEDGVKVMTVHGSKGREAPIVILPDTTRGFGRDKSGLYYHAAANINIFVPGMAIKHIAIEKIKEAAIEKEAQEDERLLYVAMTRAKDRLILCGHTFNNSYSKDSWYAHFKNAFDELGEFTSKPLQITNYEFDIPTAKIWGKIDGGEIFIERPIPEKNTQIPIWYNSKPKPFDPPPRRVAPSAMVESNYEPPSISPISGDNKNRFLRGSIIHRLLETLPQMEIGQQNDYAARILNKYPELSQEQKTEIKDTVFATINDINLGAVFGPNSRAEVSIIGKSPLLPDDIVINGAIDRMVITKDYVLILDYKTNRPAPPIIDEVSVQYINQMAAYYAVLKESFADRPIKCALLWTDGPMMMEIPTEKILDALNKFTTVS